MIVFWVPTRLHCVVKEGWVKEDVLVMLSNANEKVVGCGWSSLLDTVRFLFLTTSYTETK